ncbi:S41 family peptidase [uncultured Kiloniella sp.]|uniref:S41 family peptidase n=1 Tax=uncultured Kiloniella sp. TaxID=1133091 RepID=UPI0026275C82|nr:S41 family peptidase [uncultured Kiloniella sp.]
MPTRFQPHLYLLNANLTSRILSVFLLFFLSACGTPNLNRNYAHNYPENAEFEQKTATALYADAFEHIVHYYIEEIDASRLALAAMDNLATLDPEIDIIDAGSSLTFTYSGEAISRHSYPSTIDHKAWARLTASVISEASRFSSPLRRATGEQIHQAIFDGVAGELDKFSRYSNPDKALAYRDNRNGFSGIGIRYVKEKTGARIVSVMENTPALAVGLQEDDIIIKVDGTDIIPLPENEITKLMKGPKNTTVELTVKRPNSTAPLIYKITRKKIAVQTVFYKRMGNIAYLQISSFNKQTPQNLLTKVRTAQKEIGDNLLGYILDLRDNGGGIKIASVTSADLFVSSGTLSSVKGRNPESHDLDVAKSRDIAKGQPIIVLINANSASSSEILAAGLQDSGRALVVGSNSYGKGTVQSINELPNGGEFRVTWAKFLAPSGYAIHDRGIIPNVCTTNENYSSADDIIQRLQSGTLEMTYHIQKYAPDNPSAGESLEQIRASCPQRTETMEIDLEVAKSLISSSKLFNMAKNNTNSTTSELVN